MKTKDLKQGMIIEFEEGFLGIMVNDESAVTYSNGGYTKSMIGEDIGKGTYPITAVYNVLSNSTLQADMTYWLRDKAILDKCVVVWERKEEETVMSTKEIEDKYGIKNLKIRR